MYDLREQKGIYKGRVGECMAKLVDPGIVLTCMAGSEKYLAACQNNITTEHYSFLRKHWTSIDAVRRGPDNTIIIYEIKLRVKYRKMKPEWKTNITWSSYNVYKEAIKLGLAVKILTIWMLDDWDYEIEIRNFKYADYTVSKPREFDWYRREKPRGNNDK